MHVLIAVSIPPYSKKMLLAVEYKVYITFFSHLVSPITSMTSDVAHVPKYICTLG